MKKENKYKQLHLIALLGMIVLITAFSTMIFSTTVLAKEESKSITVPAPKLSISIEQCKAKMSFEMADSTYEDDVEYRIQCDKKGNWNNPEYDKTVYGNSYSLNWLDMGEEYSFRVRAELYYYNGEYLETPILGEWTKVVKKVIAFDPVTLKSVKNVNSTKLKIAWERSFDGEGYRIYRSTSKNSNYSLVKTIKDASVLEWTNTGLTPGKKYYYKVCTYTSYFPKPNGQFSNIKSASPSPLKKVLTAQSEGINSIKLSWKNTDTGITGYEIYRAKTKGGEYKLIKTIKDKNKLSFINTKRTFGTYYYYKIRSYCNVDGKKIYSNFSDVKKARAMVKAPTFETVKLAGITKAKLTWKKVPYASGYQIYRATSSNGTYKKIKTVKGNKTFTHTAGSLVNGKTYYFKVRAYRTVNGKTYYGDYSTVRKRLMNKLGYQYEGYESRSKRIFGVNYYKEYKTASAASKNMKTIKIKTWDINSSGKKYTRYHYLTVHKNIAETVQQIFKEIYNGKEKFPIKDVGGYSWRGDTSGSEHCEGLAIDINYNENAQFDGDTGKPLVGSLYKPGKNPYSIPANGDVVKAFEKYGFYRGDWFYNPDYMHFSYFGT